MEANTVAIRGTEASFRRMATCPYCRTPEPSPHMFTYVEYDGDMPEAMQVRYRTSCGNPADGSKRASLRTIRCSVEHWNDIAQNGAMTA